MLVLRGVELAAAGWAPETITRELERVRSQSGGFFTVDNFDRLVRSGRVGRGRAWLGTKLNLKPVMVVTPEGAIAVTARVRGAAGARRRILELLDRALEQQGRPREVRLGVVHGDIPEFAEAMRAELVARYQPRQCLVAPITPVIAAHAGVGAWGVFYQVEDGTNG
jgi:DegV family protein with EDD domain